MSLNLQAWRIPLWVYILFKFIPRYLSLNLQAWRIPLWAKIITLFIKYVIQVSTSKPGESLCG